MLKRRAIQAEFKPLYDGLVKRGEEKVRGVIRGFVVHGTRCYSRPGHLTSWSPYFEIHREGVSIFSGTRDECVSWLHARGN